MNNGRDCDHGRQVGKCDTCDVIAAELELEKVTAELTATIEQQHLLIVMLERQEQKLTAERDTLKFDCRNKDFAIDELSSELDAVKAQVKELQSDLYSIKIK
jgi:chromosome segregation ATPase